MASEIVILKEGLFLWNVEETLSITPISIAMNREDIPVRSG
jgi:hypothetical protein